MCKTQSIIFLPNSILHGSNLRARSCATFLGFTVNLTFGFSSPDCPHVIIFSRLHSSETLSSPRVLRLPISQIRNSSFLPQTTVPGCKQDTPTAPPLQPLPHSAERILAWTRIHWLTYLQSFLSLQHDTKCTFCMTLSLVPLSELIAFPMLPLFFINTAIKAPVTRSLYISLSWVDVFLPH